MENFKKWLEANEAVDQFRRNSNSQMRMDDRVNFGKDIEKKILNTLKNNGMRITLASQKEDMKDKIDGHYADENGRGPIQVKYRDSGDDILVEVMKDWHRQIPGRDMAGTAKYYVVLSRDGKLIRLIEYSEIKSIVQTALKQLEHKGFDEFNNFKTMFNGAPVELKLRKDNYSGTLKLMAYINPKALPTYKSVPADIYGK